MTHSNNIPFSYGILILLVALGAALLIIDSGEKTFAVIEHAEEALIYMQQ